MKSVFENLTAGVYTKSVEHAFLPPKLAEELLFYPTWTGHYYCSANYYIRRETYPTLLLMYVERGMFHVEFRDKIFDAGPGEVILIDCREPHYYRAYEGLEFYFYGFEGSNSREICHYILSTKGPRISSKNNHLIGNLLKNTLDFYEKNDTENIIDASLRVYKFLTLLLQTREMYQSVRNKPIEQSLTYIQENIDRHITMEQLAKIVGLSPAYFSYVFKQETGYSPREYITNARMNKAKLLLVQTNKTITEIAFEVGYANNASFTNLFTDKIGCAPKTFRKLMR